MIQLKFKVTDRSGLHSKPASLFVSIASKFESIITVSSGSGELNAKSIMGLMALGAKEGTEVTVKAKGKDEDRAISAIKDLIERNFKDDNSPAIV